MLEQQEPIGKLESLWNNLKKDNYDLPAFDKFKTDMQDDSKLQSLHKTLLKDNYDVPDFGQFKDDILPTGVKMKMPKIDKSLFEIKGGAPKSEVQPRGAEMIKKDVESIKYTENRRATAIGNQIKRQQKNYGNVDKDSERFMNGMYRDMIKSGDAVVTRDEKTGEDILAYANPNIFTAFGNTYNKLYNQKLQDNYFKGLSNQQKINDIETEQEKASVDYMLGNKPTGFFGKTGEFIAETLSMLEKPIVYSIAMASGNELMAGAGASTATMANAKSFGSALGFMEDMSNSSYVAEFNKVYNGNLKGIEQPTQEQKLTAAKNAEDAAKIAESVGAIEGALFSVPFGNLSPEIAESSQGYIDMLMQSGKHTIKEIPKLFGISTTAQIAKGEVGQQYGSKETQAQIFNEGIESGVGAVKMGIGMFGLNAVKASVPHAFTLLAKLETSPSKALDAKAKAIVSKFDNATIKKVYDAAEKAGLMPVGTGDKVIKDIDSYREAENDVPKTVKNTDAKDALAGKLQKRKALTDELNTTKVNARKKQIQLEIDKLDKEVDNIYNGENILENEQDIVGNPLKTPEPTEIGGLKVVKRAPDGPNGEVIYEMEGERFFTADGKELGVSKQLIEQPTEERLQLYEVKDKDGNIKTVTAEEYEKITGKKPEAKPIEEGQQPEEKTGNIKFKSAEGEDVYGKRVNIPGHEDFHIIIVEGENGPEVWEQSTGRKLGIDLKGSTTMENIPNEIAKYLDKNKLTSDWLFNEIDKAENIGKYTPGEQKFKLANETEGYKKYQERKKAEEESKPFVYQGEERAKLEQIKKEAEDKGDTDILRAIDIHLNSREGTSYKKQNIEDIQKQLDFVRNRNKQKGIIEKAREEKTPLPEDMMPEKKKGTIEELIQSLFQFRKKPNVDKVSPKIMSVLEEAYKKSSAILNKYGYYPDAYLESVKFNPEMVLARLVRTLNGRNLEMKAERIANAEAEVYEIAKQIDEYAKKEGIDLGTSAIEAHETEAHKQALLETVKGTEYENQARDAGLRAETAEGATGEVSAESEQKANDISHTEIGFENESDARRAYEADTERTADESYEEWKWIKLCGEI